MEHWGYGLGRVSSLDWEIVCRTAERHADSHHANWGESVERLVQAEQLRRLGLRGMAGRWSSLSAPWGRYSSDLGVVRDLIDAELRWKAWDRLRRDWATNDFECPPSLSEGGFDLHSQEVAGAVASLANLEFIESRTNAAFFGGPSTSKTSFAIAIGLQAMVERHLRVRLFDSFSLAAQLEGADSRASVRRIVRSVGRCDLLIVDAFGASPVSAKAGALFAYLLDALSAGTSVILTTRLEPERWPVPLGGDVKAVQTMGRFRRNCVVISTGEAVRSEDFAAGVDSLPGSDGLPCF